MEPETDLRKLNQGGMMTGEEMRKQICDVLLESVPNLKKATRSYMSQRAVANADFAVGAKIWKALDGIEDAAEKLSQSEF